MPHSSPSSGRSPCACRRCRRRCCRCGFSRAEKPPSSCASGWPVDLAEEVPERDVERGIAAHFGAGGAESEIADEVLRNPVDLERIAAEQLRRERFRGRRPRRSPGRKKVSPRPTSPSSVCTLSQSRLANSAMRMVSSAVIFMPASDHARRQKRLDGIVEMLRHRRLGRARIRGLRSPRRCARGTRRWPCARRHVERLSQPIRQV